MSSKMEESLGLPKREIYTSLAQLHSKIDGISASTKHWIRPAIDFSYTDNVTDTVKENETLSFLTNFKDVFLQHANMPIVEAKLSYLDGMFNSQADLLEDTRSLLINSSILHIHQENQELKQSVRIADNELKIIMLIDQVSTLENRLERVLGHKLSSPVLRAKAKELKSDIEKAKSIADMTMNGEKEIMNEIESLSGITTTRKPITKSPSSMDIFIFK